MAKPNLKWFGSDDDTIIFDVDDVSRVDIQNKCAPHILSITGYATMHIIKVEFYHSDPIEVSRWETDIASVKYQQIYDWARDTYGDKER